jgi:hypothetical protein
MEYSSVPSQKRIGGNGCPEKFLKNEDFLGVSLF